MTQSEAAVWQQYLTELLKQLGCRPRTDAQFQEKKEKD
jgi:hypothetical protein